jgi:hypothetical protein
MPDDPDDQAETWLEPAYPFNAPGEAIPLYGGSLGRSDGLEVAGAVQLRCATGLNVAWQLDEAQMKPSDLIDFENHTVSLYIPYAGGEQVLTGHGTTHGRLNGTTLGSETAPLKRVLVHWMNLPAVHSPIMLRGEGQRWARWTGRWRAVVGDWSLTLDRRSDHGEVWNVIGENKTIAMTHVMEVRRVDGNEFTVADFRPFLKTLHFGVSFALGRWVAPALPIGFDAEGQRVWEEWAPWLCDGGSNASLAWWYYSRSNDLQDLLNQAYAAFADPDRADTIRMLMAMAVQASHAGFIEQRIMIAFSGIELLSWVILKLTRGMSRNEYDDLHADGRLRQLLVEARIPTAIDAKVQPALAQFAADESGLDGPTAVARVRNRLVHPKAPQDDIYQRKGLITDAWLLTRHYLNQLILHWIGYTGSYQIVLGPGGWAGDVEPVPWAS